MKKIFLITFALITVLCTIVFASEQLQDVFNSNFPISINGQTYTPQMPVLNYQGRTYLALREFGTATNNEIDETAPKHKYVRYLIRAEL